MPIPVCACVTASNAAPHFLRRREVAEVDALEPDAEPERRQPLGRAFHHPRRKCGVPREQNLIDRPARDPLGRGRFRHTRENCVDLIPMRDEVVEFRVGLTDCVMQNELHVDEVVVAGHELAGRCAGNVAPRIRIVPDLELLRSADGYAFNAVDPPRQPDP